VTTPEKYGNEISSVADAIAKSMQYFKVDVSELVRHFSGTWATVTTHTLTNITFSPDGTYSDYYEAGYSGDFTDGGGNDLGNWGATAQDKTTARWTVRGNLRQGVLVINSPDGTEKVWQYNVHVEKGETYWREYVIDGTLYRKIRD